MKEKILGSKDTEVKDTKRQADEELVRIWSERRSSAESRQIPLYTKFKKFYDALYAVVENMSSPWRSNLYLPEFFTIIMTKASIITSKQIKFELRGTGSEDLKSANTLEKVMDYQVREPHVQPTHYNRYTTQVLDSLVTGTSIAEVPFRMQKDYFREYPIDENTGLIDTKKVKLTTRLAKWNEFLPLDSTRFFKDPFSSSLQGCSWIIVDEFRTYDEMAAKNIETPGFYDLKGVKSLPAASDNLGQYNTSRNKLLNISDKVSEDGTVKYIKIWRCYSRKYDKKTGEKYISYLEIAGGKLIIREERRLDNWHGLYPFAVMYGYNRPYEFWGLGEIEVNESIVKGLNDNVNQFFDNKNLSNNSMIMRRNSTILEPFVIEPGGEVLYDGEPPTQFRFPDPDSNTFVNAHNTLIQALERSSGVSGYSAGVPSAGVDKTRGTKGGIEQISQNANNRFGYTQRQVGDFFEQVGRIWLSNIQQYFTEDFYVRLSSGQKTLVKPEEIQGEFDVSVADTSLSPSNKQERLESSLQAIKIISDAAPELAKEGKMVKISEIVKDVVSLLNDKKPEDIITDAPQSQPEQPKKNISVTFVGENLPDGIQAELLAEQFSAANFNQLKGETNGGQTNETGRGGLNDGTASANPGMGIPIQGNGEGATAPNPINGGQELPAGMLEGPNSSGGQPLV